MRQLTFLETEPVVKQALVDTYGNKYLAIYMAEQVSAMLVEQQSSHRDVATYIWMNTPGGDTAYYVTDKIFDALGLEKEPAP